jgi:hypothetical protein
MGTFANMIEALRTCPLGTQRVPKGTRANRAQAFKLFLLADFVFVS